MAKQEINGIEVNGESIITSLKIIKQVCEDNLNSDCKNCPMYIEVSPDYSTCGVIDIQPHNWKILEYKKFQALG